MLNRIKKALFFSLESQSNGALLLTLKKNILVNFLGSFCYIALKLFFNFFLIYKTNATFYGGMDIFFLIFFFWWIWQALPHSTPLLILFHHRLLSHTPLRCFLFFFLFKPCSSPPPLIFYGTCSIKIRRSLLFSKPSMNRRCFLSLLHFLFL